MPRLVLVVLLAPLLALPRPGAAQWSPTTACDALPSTPQIGACIERQLGTADAALNDSYRRAMAFIDGSADTAPADRTAWRAALTQAQRAWIAFRDADCGAPVGYEWGQGTGSGAATLACRLAKTEQRRRELDNRYKPG